MVTDGPWLSALSSLAAEVVTLVLCQVLVGLPLWGCSASGFLGPAVFLVFTMGSPVSGRDCVLPRSAIVTTAFPPSGGSDSWPSCGVPCHRLVLCCVLRHTLVWVAVPPSHGWSCSFAVGSSSLDLVGVVGFHRFPSLYSFGMWSPFGVSSVFLSLLIANEGLHWRLFLFRYSQPFRGSVVVFLRPL